MFGWMSEKKARAQLAREFPTVPDHIVAAIFTAYLRGVPDLPSATRATRERLTDACAT